MSEKIAVAIIGALFGFSLPYLANVWERVRRAHHMRSALNRELAEVISDIERKMEWLSRDVSGHLHEVDAERVVRREGIHLYLGEREQFSTPRPYWLAKYTDIAEAIRDEDFSAFYVRYRLVDRFEQKFREMKSAFDGSAGNRAAIALAIFEDLRRIRMTLRETQNRR